MTGKKLTLWEVLDKYADIRDDLEDVLYPCAELEDFLAEARQEMHDELERIQNELNLCDQVFQRYKVVPECHTSMEADSEEMPF